MSFPVPRPGLVIRYSFLWSHERAKGAEEASKDRPCAIVVAVRKTEQDDLRVIVAPITHQSPPDPKASVEIPAHVCRALGLDGEQQWLRTEELNSFAWPGFDLRPIPGTQGRYDYGMLPQELFEKLKQAILARDTAQRRKITPRD
ncbi:MAG: type II toxin-antitoxin system PemK/MazF family toxin [Rhodospirillaceae bacterium]|nr:type II toxin-antitoxin system PemK/MazF family toxin [Rhodospirillaceae bacterium]